MNVLAVLLLVLVSPPQNSKAKGRLFFYPESTYTSAFKATFLRVCKDVELSETEPESKYKAEVGSSQDRFTWILRDWRGKALSFDERSSMEDAAASLCKAAKNQ
jgi:hypothetical protein